MLGKVFLAGAAGAIGARLAPLLCAAGFQVTGTTRRPGKVALLKAAGVTPVVVDVYDAAALVDAVAAARPEIVIHQLTDLPPGMDPALLPAALPANARLRIEGTRNLIDGALRAGARRVIAQSIAFVYRPGPEPHGEQDPLDVDAAGTRAVTVDAVATLERLVTATPGIDGVVLRYGFLYGPGTGAEAPRGPSSVHVDAAAWAALLAIDRAAPGLYNIAEEGAVTSLKAQRALGWRPDFRISAAPAR